jgi:hypothetical protein
MKALWKKYRFQLCGVAVAVITGFIWRAMPTAEQQRVAELIDRNAAVAEEKATTGLDPQLKAVHELFKRARLQGTRAFAQDVLGWESKYKMTKDFFFSTGDHGRYLQERFAEHIFSQSEIERTIESSVAGYLKHLDSVESEMLVRLEADLVDTAPADSPIAIDRASIEAALNRAIAEAVQAVAADTRGMIGQELVSYIAGDVLTIAAIELATSSGILSAGAASGTVTLGVGLVVGLIVDYLVSWAYDQYYNPVGQLERQLDEKLTELERFIVSGTEKNPGLEKRLQDYAAQRAKARRVAITAAIMP